MATCSPPRRHRGVSARDRRQTRPPEPSRAWSLASTGGTLLKVDWKLLDSAGPSLLQHGEAPEIHVHLTTLLLSRQASRVVTHVTMSTWNKH